LVEILFFFHSDYRGGFDAWYCVGMILSVSIFAWVLYVGHCLAANRRRKSKAIDIDESILLLLIISSFSMVIWIAGMWEGLHTTRFIFSTVVNVMSMRLSQLSLFLCFILVLYKLQQLVWQCQGTVPGGTPFKNIKVTVGIPMAALVLGTFTRITSCCLCIGLPRFSIVPLSHFVSNLPLSPRVLFLNVVTTICSIVERPEIVPSSPVNDIAKLVSVLTYGIYSVAILIGVHYYYLSLDKVLISFSSTFSMVSTSTNAAEQGVGDTSSDASSSSVSRSSSSTVNRSRLFEERVKRLDIFKRLISCCSITAILFIGTIVADIIVKTASMWNTSYYLVVVSVATICNMVLVVLLSLIIGAHDFEKIFKKEQVLEVEAGGQPKNIVVADV
jgi:hypothetical protein